ncbi:Six-hairpin glycosidase-like protein [Dipodascopsis tothii]|uniref:Six-hairpin glycosidase-like protein n=1 Tax=Dipodascopsis tothii TaxID=44089 RepID=UPI0034CFFC38
MAGSSSFETWLEQQSAFSFQSILDNIGPDGKNVAGQGVLPGTVVASPSRQHPNYFYQWIRDGAITIRALVDEYAATGDERLRQVLDDYLATSRTVQHASNPSGDFWSGGLGEPKFEVDGTAFEGHWGRPQRDGPPLRALTMMAYMRALVQVQGGELADYAAVYDMIKPDLEYTSHTWASPGFDLWEEVDGLHFFTAMVQYKALRAGQALAAELGDDGAVPWYRKQADELARFMYSFWDERHGHLVETLAHPRSGLDAALLLGAIHGGDGQLFPPHSDPVIASLHALVADMRARHVINADRQAATAGVGVGRYPEDVYDGDGTRGGNPWFLCTSTVAHTLYLLAEHLATSSRPLVITNTTAAFYQPFWAAAGAGDLLEREVINAPDSVAKLRRSVAVFPSTAEYDAILSQVFAYADSFMAVIRDHADAEGHLSEQFDTATGYERGAEKLTWSYESFWNACRARDAASTAIALRKNHRLAEMSKL